MRRRHLRSVSPSYVVSGLRCEVDENCVLLGCCSVSSGSSLLTFRENLSVPSSRGKNPKTKPGTLVRDLHRKNKTGNTSRGVYVGKSFATFPLLPSLTTLIRRFPLFSSLLRPLEIFHSQNVLLQSNTDDYTSLSLLPPTSTLLAGTTLLMLITAQALPCINPVLDLPAFFLDS
jgi:hypothetical protein